MERIAKDKSGKAPVLKQNSTYWLWDITKGKRRFVLALIGLQIILNVGNICYSLLFRDLIDRAVERQLPDFYDAMGALIALAVVQLLVRATARWLEEYVRSGVENGVKHHFFGVLLHRSFASVTQVHTGEWMNRLTSDTVVVADGIAQILPHLGGILVRVVGAFSLILILEPYLGVVIVPVGLAFLAAARLFRPRLKRLHAEVRQADGSVRMLLQERLDNQLIVRAFAQQNRTLELAAERMTAHHRARMKQNRTSNLYNIGFGFIMQGMYLLGAFIGCVGIVDGTISFGTLTAVLQLISLLQSPLSEIGSYFTQWYAMLASAERLMEAEDCLENDSGKDPTEAEILRFYQQVFAGISIEHVSFSYMETGNGKSDKDPCRVTIGDFNMRLQKGEFIAVVGSSGCGKSTLLKLLMGLYTPDSGSIRILRKRPLESRALGYEDRGLFAYVPQGNQLMSGTIRQVLAFNDCEKMRQEQQLWQALKIACADDFVSQLPQGLDAVLGEHGSGLSEGQIQRLALARAVFSQRPILLLDEATSSLDETTEQKLLHNLRTMTDRTVLLVTHRPRACEICDRIVQFQSNQNNSGNGA